MAQTIELERVLACPADLVWEKIHDPRLFTHVMAPLIRLRPIEPKVFPERLVPAYYVVGMRAFGILPLGRQVIHIEHPAPEPGEPLPRYLMHDQGSGDLVQVWDHRISIEPLSEKTCRYTDRVTIEAGVLTPLVALIVRFLFRHRQMRLGALVARGFRY